MPSFHPPGTRKGNRHWLARGRIKGRLYEISLTGAANKIEAREAWAEFEADVRACNEPEPCEVKTFQDAIAHYEATERRSLEQLKWAEKIANHRHDGIRIGDLPVADIRPGLIRTIAPKIYPNLKASSLNRSVITVARAVINCAADDEWCPHIRIKRFKETPAVKEHPSDDAGELMFQNADGDLKLLIAFYHFQGFRPSDALALEWDGIDLKHRRFQAVIGKAAKTKWIPMDEHVFELLANEPQEARQGRLFPWGDKWAWKLIKRLRDRLGVSFGARMARHKFASDIAADGGSAWDVMNAGTWTDTRATDHYVTLDQERAAAVLRQRNQRHLVGKFVGKGKKR